MLDVNARSSPFLSVPESPPNVPSATASPAVAAPGALVGRRLGPYQLVRVLASGGMGSVYEALQDRPERRVAVKVLRRGLFSPSARHRFEYESEILARLRHPAIAQVFDAGAWQDPDQPESVLPYFVLELVPDARPLTSWCREQKLDLEARLALFAQICDAVHHGHQKGVIHRDLKPGNLLVDGQGHPKVIDFGVARCTDADQNLTTEHTQAGQLLGTLQYMSPEQCGGDPDEVDVRSDVYSLGVVLYELLTGVLPYDLSGAPLARALEVVRESPPVRPGYLRKELAGDLETILLKALAKEPAQRYASAADLVEDLERWRRHEPIRARPQSALYEMRKFVRRNRVLVGAAVLTVVGLAVGLFVALHGLGAAEEALAREGKEKQTAQAERNNARREARINAMVNDFLNRDLLAAARPEARGRDVPLGVVLDEAAARLPGRFLNEPAVAARLHDTIGITYRELGDYEAALRQFESAIARARASPDFDARFLLTIRIRVPGVLILLTRYDDAERLIEELEPETDRVCGARSADAAGLRTGLGNILFCRGEYDRCIEVQREALALWEEAAGPDDPETGRALSNLAICLRRLSRHAEAEPLLRRALEIHERHSGPDHPETLNIVNNLGVLYFDWGRPEDGKKILEEALPRFDRALKPDHPITLGARASLAECLSRMGDKHGAARIYGEVVPAMSEKLGPGSRQTLLYAGNWANVLRDLKRFDECQTLYEETIARMRDSLGEDHELTVNALCGLAKLFRMQRRLVESRDVYEEILSIIDASELIPERDRLLIRLDYGSLVLLPLEEYEEAEQVLREAFAGFRRLDGDRNKSTAAAAEDLVRIFHATGRAELEAEWKKIAEQCRPPDEGK